MGGRWAANAIGPVLGVNGLIFTDFGVKKAKNYRVLFKIILDWGGGAPPLPGLYIAPPLVLIVALACLLLLDYYIF